jgi:hypothetical protein
MRVMASILQYSLNEIAFPEKHIINFMSTYLEAMEFSFNSTSKKQYDFNSLSTLPYSKGICL